MGSPSRAPPPLFRRRTSLQRRNLLRNRLGHLLCLEVSGTPAASSPAVGAPGGAGSISASSPAVSGTDATVTSVSPSATGAAGTTSLTTSATIVPTIGGSSSGTPPAATGASGVSTGSNVSSIPYHSSCWISNHSSSILLCHWWCSASRKHQSCEFCCWLEQ